jgi:hypothetical protein
MIDELERAVSLSAPVLVGLVVHGLCMKFGWLSALAVPIDAGRTFRERRLLGENKTWRGVIAVGFGTALGFLLRAEWSGASRLATEPAWLHQPSASTFAFGLFVGVSAMLFELPNSFVKRQLDIRPGAQGRRTTGAIFYIIDQIDMLVGICLALAFAVPISLEFILWSAAFLFVAHQIITVIGYALGMRATWR